MKSIREFFEDLPVLCESKYAEQFKFLNSVGFVEEAQNPKSVFSREVMDKIDLLGRVDPAFGFTAFPHNEAKAKYCKSLARLAELSHRKIAHGETQWDEEIGVTYEQLLSMPKYLDVDTYLTPDEAVTLAAWNV